MDDVGIERRVRGGRYGSDETMQIVASPHFFEIAVFQ